MTLTEEEKFDKILELFRSNSQNKYSLYTGIDELLKEIDLTDLDFFTRIKQQFLEEGLLKELGNDRQLFLTTTGMNFSYYKELINNQKERLNLFTSKTLKEVLQTFENAQKENINNFLLENYSELKSVSIFRALNTLLINNFINCEIPRKLNHPNLKLKEAIQQVRVEVSITKEGYNHITNNDTNISNQTIIGVNHGVIVKDSNNTTVSIKNKGIDKEYINTLIHFFQNQRNEDLELLTAALKDIEEGKALETKDSEKLIELGANLTQIASFIIPYLKN